MVFVYLVPVLVLALLYRWLSGPRRRLPSPPGALFLLGHVRQLSDLGNFVRR